MDFGTLKTTYVDVADIVKYSEGYVARTLRNYRIRVKVANSQEEMSEFIRFTGELERLKDEGRLAVDKEDGATYPAFVIEYPKNDYNGARFVVKSYTVIV